VSFFNKELLKQYSVCLSWIIAVYSFIAIFVKIENIGVLTAIIVPLITAFFSYVLLLIKSNLMITRKIIINNSTIHLKFGDIFHETDWKVIPFNEYFDTQVDEKIIARSTLNGQFLKNHITDILALDNAIESNLHLKERKQFENIARTHGKKIQYKLGTIHIHEDYMLTALSRFDDDGKAFLNISDYFGFLMNFWLEVDKYYAGKSVTIPLIGSGITRFKDSTLINEQELLEIILWTFKLSRLRFAYPSCINIIISPDKKNKINLYELNIKNS